MKKLAVLMAVLFICGAFAGCEGPGLPDEEAAGVVAELVEQSLDLNRIYYGDGLRTVADGDENYAGYYADVVDEEAYKTEKELREATLRVFTENYAQSIFEMFLTGYSDGDTSTVYARYVENGDRLQKNMKSEQMLEDDRTYDLEDITITRSRAKTIVAVLHSYVNGEKSVDVEVTARRVEVDPKSEGIDIEDGSYETTKDGKIIVWRLDSPTY